MNDNLRLFLKMEFNGRAAAEGLSRAGGAVRRFTSGAGKAFDGLRRRAHELSAAMGGVSQITRLAGAYIGLSAAREAFQKNMHFDETLLESKQLVGLTEQQTQAVRRLIMTLSERNIFGPTEYLAGLRVMANAGVKDVAVIEASLKRAGAFAAATHSNIAAVADLDIDLVEKMGLAPSQIGAAHNMGYYHARSGRFEASYFSAFAPEYLNAMSVMGVKGLTGFNFIGAVLQAVQKIKPETQPAETVTVLERGMESLLKPREIKQFKSAGIDIKKFAPGGAFRGVEGMFGLLGAMKKAGLGTDKFKLAKIFRDTYERQFWEVLLAHMDEIKAAMKEADAAAKKDQVAVDYKEILAHPYAKQKLAANAVERAQESDAATKAAGVYGDVVSFAWRNPLQAAMIGGGLAIGGRMLYRRLLLGKGGGASAGGALGAAAGLAGVQRVFVVNMPGGGMSGGGQLALPPGEEGAAAGAAKASRWGRALHFGKGAALIGGGLAVLTSGIESYGVYKNKQLDAEAKKLEYGRIDGGAGGEIAGMIVGGVVGGLAGPAGAMIGASIAGAVGKHIGEWLGKQAAQKIVLQSNLHMDGRVLARQVQEYVAQDYLRGD